MSRTGTMGVLGTGYTRAYVTLARQETGQTHPSPFPPPATRLAWQLAARACSLNLAHLNQRRCDWAILTCACPSLAPSAADIAASSLCLYTSGVKVWPILLDDA